MPRSYKVHKPQTPRIQPQFPLSLLNAAIDNPVLIELKNGFNYNGLLVSVDQFMNVCLRDVILTSKNGDRFWSLATCMIRGPMIKYFRVEPELADKVKDDDDTFGGLRAGSRGRGRGRGRGGRGARGGRGGRGGGRGRRENRGGGGGGRGGGRGGHGSRGDREGGGRGGGRGRGRGGSGGGGAGGRGRGRSEARD